MNFYLRYFDDETLVYSVEEAIEFLASIPEINMTSDMEEDIRDFAANDVFFPKRYRVRPRVYFIIIKTEAQTLQDFKDKKALRRDISTPKSVEQNRLLEAKSGWYEARIDFKRVVVNHLGKCEYRDTTFVAQCIADSPMHCYERIVAYLKERVDERSQFPSVKGKNFDYEFLGCVKLAESDYE